MGVFFAPKLLHPLREGFTKSRVLRVIASHEVVGYRQTAYPHHDASHLAHQKVGECGRAFRIDDGYVQNGLELVAHGVERQSHAARLGLEQVAVGRLLSGVLACRKAGAFQKVHDAGGDEGVFGTGFAGGFLVFATHFGVFLEVVLGMAAHEGKFKCPPRQTHHRYPYELLLQEEFKQWNASVQQVLQYQNVHPRLVVAVDHVPAVRVQPFNALHVPGGALGQAHPGAVAPDPGFGNGQEDGVDGQAHPLEGQDELERGEKQQDGYPEQRVNDHQQRSNQEDQRRGEKVEHDAMNRVAGDAVFTGAIALFSHRSTGCCGPWLWHRTWPGRPA